MKQNAMNLSAQVYLITFAFCLLIGLSPAYSTKPGVAFSDSTPIKIHKKMTQLASFPGGVNALSEFVKANQRYLPFKNNVESDLKGIIVIEFVVTTQGKIIQPSVFSKIGEDIKEDLAAENEALRLVKMMPNWKPGLVKKKAVNSYSELVVSFGKDIKSNPYQGAVIEFEAPPPPFISNDENQPIPNSDLWAVVEKMPIYPEGQAALIRFLDQNLKYPQIAEDNAVEGMIVLQMVVEKDGSLTNLKILKGLGYGCDEEAIRLVQLMPKWIPGAQKGSLVRVRYNLPIRFKLK